MGEFLVLYGGDEVINTERLQAYLDNGIGPGDTQFTIDTCLGLAEALGGPEEYRSPLLDQPAWWSADDDDTLDFAGLLPLGITGLNGTTRVMDYLPTTDGYGVPGKVTRGPATLGVTAVLVGRTSEGVQAGLSWLRRTLHRLCDGDEAPCGPTAEVEVFTTCPGPISATPNPDVTTTDTEPHPFDGAGDPSAWTVANGTLTDNGDGTLVTPFPTEPDLITAGGAPEEGDIITADAGTEEPIILGSAAGAAGQATVGVFYTADCTRLGDLTIVWRIRSVAATGVAQPVILGADGIPIDTGPLWSTTDTFSDYTWDVPGGVSSDEPWRVGLIVYGDHVVESADITYHPPLSAADCVAPYRRRFPLAATVSGPTVTEEFETDCATLLVVEWIWTTGPYQYGTDTTLVLGIGFGDAPSYAAPGVTYDEGDGVTLTDATPWNCAAPDDEPLSCALDPIGPTFGTPPALPDVTDTVRVTITTEDVRDVSVVIGPEQVPASDGVLTIALTAGPDPVVGARVRVWDDAAIDGTVPDECGFVYEYLIDYIPANGVLTIDGVTGLITTLCDGAVTPEDSAQMVRGDYGGPTEEPVIRCDRRYLVRLQWFDTYPRGAVDGLPGSGYTLGDPNGTLTMDLYVTPREG